jgi:hypothetical protein
MNPRWITDNSYSMIIKEYAMVKDFNIPLASTLDEADANTLEEFGIIKTEISALEQYMGEKNGK